MSKNLIPLSVPDSDIPCEVHYEHLAPIVERRKQKTAALYAPAMPLSVVSRARDAFDAGPYALWVVALHYRLELGKPFAVRQNILEDFGIKSRTWCRYVRQLEAAGFIRTRNRPSHRPEITLIDEEYVAWLR